MLLYTSVRAGGLDLGRVGLARPLDGDLVGWRKHAGNPVLEPPPDLGLVHFRDPFVWGRPGDWSMLVGAGLAGGRGAVLRYTSPDLDWRFRGVLAAGGGELGGTWECPQYVDLGGFRALVVSVLAAGALTRVMAARGTERDGTFAPAEWETLGHGGSAYALTTYRDRAGRLAGTAWLRHDDTGEPRTGWAGMLSLPVVLSARAGGGVHVAPHPDVDTLRAGPLPIAGGGVDLAGAGGVAELAATLPAGAQLRLESAGPPVRLTATGAGLLVESAAGTARVPAAGPPVALRVLVDRGAVEAWTGDGRWIALRLPALAVRGARLGGGGSLAAWRLEPVQQDPAGP